MLIPLRCIFLERAFQGSRNVLQRLQRVFPARTIGEIRGDRRRGIHRPYILGRYASEHAVFPEMPRDHWTARSTTRPVCKPGEPPGRLCRLHWQERQPRVRQDHRSVRSGFWGRPGRALRCFGEDSRNARVDSSSYTAAESSSPLIMRQKTQSSSCTIVYLSRNAPLGVAPLGASSLPRFRLQETSPFLILRLLSFLLCLQFPLLLRRCMLLPTLPAPCPAIPAGWKGSRDCFCSHNSVGSESR